jgi:hypothetical protein
VTEVNILFAQINLLAPQYTILKEKEGERNKEKVKSSIQT